MTKAKLGRCQATNATGKRCKNRASYITRMYGEMLHVCGTYLAFNKRYR